MKYMSWEKVTTWAANIANMVGSSIIDEIAKEVDKEDGELWETKCDSIVNTHEIEDQLKVIEEKEDKDVTRVYDIDCDFSKKLAISQTPANFPMIKSPSKRGRNSNVTKM